MIFTDRTFQTLLSREILRFTRVWMQTLVPQLLTSLLYLVVFGIALGGRIKQIEGIPYLDYILPGIALMSLITNSQMNSSWSVFDAKRERYIDEVLISPMSDLQIALAYSLGGMLRGVVMGAAVFIVGVPFVGVQIKVNCSTRATSFGLDRCRYERGTFSSFSFRTTPWRWASPNK